MSRRGNAWMAGRLNLLVCACAAALTLLLGTSAEAATARRSAQMVLLRPAMDVPLRPSKDAPAPEPAMWKIVNGKSTVYLLGSIHLLPAGVARDHRRHAGLSFERGLLAKSGASQRYFGRGSTDCRIAHNEQADKG